MALSATSLIERLAGEENTRRSALLALAVDHAFALPLRTFIHVDDIADVLTEALTEANAEKFIEDEVHPLRARVLEHFRKTGETPKDLLPERTPDRLIAIVAKGDRPRGEWAKGAVDVAPLRALLAPVIQNVLLRFTQRLPIPGLGGDGSASAPKPSRSSGMFGSALRKGAGSIADIGKAALGNISGEVEKKIQTVTRDFSTQAMGEIREALRERFASDEGQEVIRKIRVSLVERILETPVHMLMEDGDRAPVEGLVGLVPAILEHNRARPELRAFIQSEVAYQLEAYGDKSLAEVLDSYGLHTTLRQRVLAQLDAPVRQFVESKGFESWLTELLSDD